MVALSICSRLPSRLDCIPEVIRQGRSLMATAALKQRPAPALKHRPAPAPKTFHATMLVTRAEEWCVEAETAEEARVLLAAGQGHRCHVGERLQFEVERVED
jgi:hypothetical protein